MAVLPIRTPYYLFLCWKHDGEPATDSGNGAIFGQRYRREYLSFKPRPRQEEGELTDLLSGLMLPILAFLIAVALCETIRKCGNSL
jgi:hypothetical protein